MRRMLAVVVAACALAGAAWAPDPGPDGAISLEVGMGETVERSVGIALGLRCDDLGPARFALRTDAGANTFVVTGVKLGETTCRVGTAPNRPTFLFEIHVVPPRPAPTSPSPPPR